MELLQLEEYGFQQTTGFHCRPLKYMVSLRGREAAISAALGVGGTAVGGTAVGCVTGAVVGAGVGVPQAARTIEAMINADTTRNSFFMVIFLLLRLVEIKILSDTFSGYFYFRSGPPFWYFLFYS